MLWLIIGIVFLVLVWFLIRPISIQDLESNPDPVSNYEDALLRLDSIHDEESGMQLFDVCQTKLMTHGSRQEHVIVFIHGYSTCPEQFQVLGERFFELGYNVFIPCMPFHGREDRLSDDLSKLTAEDMAAFGDRVLDIAVGLGRKVTVFGISGGGTVTAWLAQYRADLDYAVPLAAFLAINLLPSFLSKPFMNVFLTLPNFYIWWDPRTGADSPFSPPYAYPRFSFRTVSQVMRLGLALTTKAKTEKPKAGKILVMINDNDPGVSNRAIEKLEQLWQTHGMNNLVSYHFPREMKMVHDIISPGTPGIPTEMVNETIIEQIKLLHQSE
jgi:carboxylesterase